MRKITKRTAGALYFKITSTSFEGGAYKKIHQKEIQYVHNIGIPVNYHQIELPDVYESVPGAIYSPDYRGDPNNPYITFREYNLYTGKYDIKKVTETTYSDVNGHTDSLMQETSYEYGQTAWYKDSLFHYFPSKEIKKTSTGTDTSFYYYPYDWRNNVSEILPSEYTILSDLEQNNRIQIPTVQKNKNGNSPVYASKLLFGYYNTNQLNPSVFKEKRGSASDFSDRVYFDKFDTLGNVLEQHKVNDITESYLYGYNNSYPVVKVVGATFSTISALVDSALLNNSTNQYSDLQVRNELNKIRTGLSNTNAQVFTYTYKPMVGMTSATDPNGRTTFYEYDSFGRLFLIRDKDNNILKKICYNYAGQPEDCDCVTGYADWQNTATALRCKKDSNNKNTGDQEQEQKDMNSCSVTFNQLRWVVSGTNLTACPLPVNCNSSNCSGDNKKCINNNCETGIRVNTDTYPSGSQWVCVYHYEWSDGSWSQNYTSTSRMACPI